MRWRGIEHDPVFCLAKWRLSDAHRSLRESGLARDKREGFAGNNISFDAGNISKSFHCLCLSFCPVGLLIPLELAQGIAIFRPGIGISFSAFRLKGADVALGNGA